MARDIDATCRLGVRLTQRLGLRPRGHRRRLDQARLRREHELRRRGPHGPELTKRRDAARAAGDDALEKQLTMQMRALVERAYRPVAFVGRVPVKVTGPVRVGDHLAASAVPGRAMAMGKAGQSIGVALEASAGGDGKILVLIQPKYFVPPVLTEDPATLDAVTAQLDRVLVENEELKARLDRLEAALRSK